MSDASRIREAMAAYKAGGMPDDRVARELVAHPAWHVPVDDAQHAALWTVDGVAWLAAMSEPTSPNGAPTRFLTLRGRHLVRNLASDAQGLAFDLGLPHGLALGRDAFDTLRSWADVLDVEDALAEPAPDQVASLLGHRWLVLCRDGAPVVETHKGVVAVRIFTATDTLRAYLEREPQFQSSEIRRIPGDVLFAHLAARDDFDGVWVNPHHAPESEPFAPDMPAALAEGREWRPEAQVLRARSVAEIHEFLDQQGMSREDRRHTLGYVGGELVAHYTGTIIGRAQRSFRFFPVEPLADPLDFGPGPTAILCAGQLADHARRRLAALPSDPAAVAPEDREYAAGAARWLFELVKLLGPDLPALPRAALRTCDGARFVREFPQLATRGWIVAAHRLAEALAGTA